MSEKVQGTLVIIGGAEDKTGERVILRRFVELAGGEKARLVVVTSATSRPQIVGDGYSRLFKDLGVQEVSILNVASRQEANVPSAYQAVLDATGIFFTGGDQLRITSLLGGTRLDEAFRKAYREGTIMAEAPALVPAMMVPSR